MKTKAWLIFMTGFLLCLTGCQNTEVSCAAITVQDPKIAERTLPVFEEPAVEEEPYFTVTYEEASIDVLLSDCVCEYADTDFQIYSKFVYYDKETFPYCGTVIYMQTPTDTMQIFPAQDYCVDKENGVIYLGFSDEDKSFISAYKYFAPENSGEISISGAKFISTYLVEDWIADTFELALNGESDCFSDIRLRITSIEYEQGEVILGGKASGVYSATGERYHIDWEVNDTTGEEGAVPHIFKVYDEEKDAEIFKACQEAFDLIEQGDWSVIMAYTDIPWPGMYWREGYNATACYKRMDVNGDGLPELLIGQSVSDRRQIPIDYIYAYTGGTAKTVELVYTDLNDYTEYLFPGSEYLIYNYSDHGQTHYGSYTRYQFDENWQKQPSDKIVIYGFYDTDYYDEEEDAWYKEYYPDTYGNRGGGYYFFKGSPIFNEGSKSGITNDWSQEEITEEEFAEIYREMAGFDFWEENTDFYREIATDGE